jgi:hypothetical protein
MVISFRRMRRLGYHNKSVTRESKDNRAVTDVALIAAKRSDCAGSRMEALAFELFPLDRMLLVLGTVTALMPIVS